MPHSALISSLKQRQWLFDDIEPHFRRSLMEKLGRPATTRTDSTESTAALSAEAYRNITMKPATEAAISTIQFADTNHDHLFWELAVQSIHPSARLGTFDEAWKSSVLLSIQKIQTVHPLPLQSFLQFPRFICGIESADFRSASHPHFFGVLFVTPNLDPLSLSISLIHEIAHQELFLLNLTDRLVTASTDFALVHSPLQGRVRPPIGRLHSAHALFRMSEYEELVSPKKAAHHRKLLIQTIDTFQPSELTDLGKKLVYEVYK